MLSAMSKTPLSLPFRLASVAKSNEDRSQHTSDRVSCSTSQRQTSPLSSASRLPSHMVSDALMSGSMMYDTIGQNNFDSGSTASGTTYMPRSTHQCSPIAFDMATNSAGLDLHHHFTQDETLEPKLMFLNQHLMLWNTSPSSHAQQMTNALAYDQTSYLTSLPQSIACNYVMSNESENLFDSSNPTSEVSTLSPGDDLEDLVDKPYARLIYEALMQAPGHRMMLREIYDWFAENTSKVQGSSSNGWQNSIRHNLSMNQAFENDKVSQSGCGHGRKANSVWFLTEEAIKNGVQSTTRFRKPGPPKRCHNQRTSQVQRQRSGAKGGKATRRSMSMRRHETASTPKHDFVTTHMQPSHHHSNDGEIPSHMIGLRHADRPLTPADDLLFEHVYGLPRHDHHRDLPWDRKDVTLLDAKDIMHDYAMETLYEDLTALEQDSMSLGHVYV